MLTTMAAPSVVVLESPLIPLPHKFHVQSKFLDFRVDRFAHTVEDQLAQGLAPETMEMLSATLQDHFGEACKSSKVCMLPSFCHALPTGHEEGIYLAVDVGGSTLRVGLIRLSGRCADGEALTVLTSRHHVIDDAVRSLVGRAFFEWMADRIYETLEGDSRWLQHTKPLRVGLAWSYPVE